MGIGGTSWVSLFFGILGFLCVSSRGETYLKYNKRFGPPAIFYEIDTPLPTVYTSLVVGSNKLFNPTHLLT